MDTFDRVLLVLALLGLLVWDEVDDGAINSLETRVKTLESQIRTSEKDRKRLDKSIDTILCEYQGKREECL